jgi:hypothetical protein
LSSQFQFQKGREEEEIDEDAPSQGLPAVEVEGEEEQHH